MEARKKQQLRIGSQNITTFIKIITVIYYIYFILMVLVGSYLLFNNEGFSVRLFNVGKANIGYAYFRNILPVFYPIGLLRDGAIDNPKLVYMIGFFVGLIAKGIIAYGLYNIKKIFENLEEETSPFDLRIIKRIKIISILIIVYGIVIFYLQSGLLIITSLYQYASDGFATIIPYVLVSLIVFGLALIFEYGSYLQQEADETL